MAKGLIIMLLMTGMTGMAGAASGGASGGEGTTGTTWDLRPSLAFDTLCFLNALTGDPFYLSHFQAEYDSLYPRLPGDAQEAMRALDRRVRTEDGGILSAVYTLYFSAVDPSDLDDLLKAIDDPEPMRAALLRSPYYNDEGWETFLATRGDLRRVLLGLRAAGFEEQWRRDYLPRAEARIAAVTPVLAGADVIGEVEKVLGKPLQSRRITVYMLCFTRPHGIKITGTRFLTDIAWPAEIVLRNAVHEMMHPPFDLAADPELRDALATLRADSLLMDKVEHHNPVFGYNTFEGLVEEDVVQSLDQVLSERMGFAREPRARWKESDDGIHVLAVALYQLMQERGSDLPPIRTFLLEEIGTGRLGPGRIGPLHERFYAARDH